MKIPGLLLRASEGTVDLDCLVKSARVTLTFPMSILAHLPRPLRYKQPVFLIAQLAPGEIHYTFHDGTGLVDLADFDDTALFAGLKGPERTNKKQVGELWKH